MLRGQRVRRCVAFSLLATAPLGVALLTACELVDGLGSITYATDAADATNGDAAEATGDAGEAGGFDSVTCPVEAGPPFVPPRTYALNASRLLPNPYRASRGYACVEAQEVSISQYTEFLGFASSILMAYRDDYPSDDPCFSPGRCARDTLDAGYIAVDAAGQSLGEAVTHVLPCAAELYCWSINRDLCPADILSSTCKMPGFVPPNPEFAFDTSCTKSGCTTSCRVVWEGKVCQANTACPSARGDTAFRCCAPAKSETECQ
jgi:hypothetical protein